MKWTVLKNLKATSVLIHEGKKRQNGALCVNIVHNFLNPTKRATIERFTPNLFLPQVLQKELI